MIKLNDKTISLLIVDTREHDQAMRTIDHNRKLMHFDEVLFFTNPSELREKWTTSDGITICTIPEIQHRDQYSNIILTGIAQHVKTDLVLITQCDGFIYSADGWKDEFATYDYIGAPWWYYPYNHVPPHPPSGPRTCVGNGGFSLRSRNLVQAVNRLTRSMNWPTTVPEDLFICRTLRPHLEELGCRWAPEHLAYQFCCEDRPYEGQFGVHGHETFKLNQCLQKP